MQTFSTKDLSSAKKHIFYPSAGYDRCYELEEKSYWFQHRFQLIHHLIQKFAMNGHILDFGGGNGFISKQLQNRGFDVTLCEPGEAGVQNASRRGVKKILQANENNLIQQQFRADIILCCDVLEHIPDDHLFLAKLQNILSPQGYLILTVPAFQHLWSDDDREAGHFRRYSSSVLKNVLQKNNYQVIYLKTFFSFLYLPLLLLKAIPFRFFKKKFDPQKSAKDHLPTNKVISKMIASICKWECSYLLKKWSPTFWGTSLIVIAIPKKT